MTAKLPGSYSSPSFSAFFQDFSKKKNGKKLHLALGEGYLLTVSLRYAALSTR